MKTVQISLNSIDKVKAFVNELTKYDNEFRSCIRKIRYRCKINHGYFQFGFSKPIDLNIHADSNIDDILAALDAYIIK